MDGIAFLLICFVRIVLHDLGLWKFKDGEDDE